MNKQHIDTLQAFINDEGELNKFIESVDAKTYVGEYLSIKAYNNDITEVQKILDRGPLRLMD